MEYQINNGILRIYLSGDIDHHSAGEIRKEIDRLILQSEPQEVVLNFRRVQFCDSSGIAVVLGRYKLSVSEGFTLALEELPSSVENIFRLSKIDNLVEFRKKEKISNAKIRN